jgi:hypothetical protein
MRYFDIIPDDRLPQWMLDVPLNSNGDECDPWPFTEGHRLCDYGPLTIPIEYPGPAMDFSFAHFGIPIVSPEVGNKFRLVAGEDVQLLPAKLSDGRSMYVLVVARLEDCLDHERSTLTYHQPGTGRPDKIGKPNMVVKLIIDPKRARGRKVLRIRDWEESLIVSEEVAEAMQQWEVTGVKFLPVTP